MKQGTRKKLVAAAAGAFDPILRKWAQKLAARVPQKSFVRSQWFEIAAGVLKGFTEVATEHLPLPVWTTVEKATDFGDFFAGALGAHEQQFTDLTNSWVQKFLEEAAVRIEKAENPKTEMERLKLELELRRELVKAMEEASALKGEDKPKGSLRKSLEVIAETLKKADEKLKPTADALRKLKEEKQRKAGFRK